MRRRNKTFFVVLVQVLVFAITSHFCKAQGRSSRRLGAGINNHATNFNCPEEFGYYAHPDDCTQYYVCVFGGALLESCTGGLMYSQELQTCDWPRNVGCNSTVSSGSTFSTIRVTDPRTRKTTPLAPASSATVSSLSPHLGDAATPRRVNDVLRVASGFNTSPQNPQVLQSLYGADEFGLGDEDSRDDRQGRSYQGHQPSLSNSALSQGKSNRRSGLRPQQQGQARSAGLAPQYVSDAPLRQLVDTRNNNRFQQQQPKLPEETDVPSASYPFIPQQYQQETEDPNYATVPVRPVALPPVRTATVPAAPSTLPTPYVQGNASAYSDADYEAYYVYEDYPEGEYPTTGDERDIPRTAPSPAPPTRIPVTRTQQRPIVNLVTQGVTTTLPPVTRSIANRGSVRASSRDVANNPRVSNRGSPSSSSKTANRGRVRPTLKPTSAVVAGASEYIDIFKYPPKRLEPVYEQPPVDQPATKCRRDTCLVPDCFCGGKEVPVGFRPEDLPQIVMLTFDDSVNDLNKGLYESLFQKGRTNANGCPISATFYVSHEWTDYSQVQNLYSDGHEIASHSISHSFGEQFSQRKWAKEIGGQREILAAFGGVKLEDVRGMRAPFLAIGGNNMFKMLYDTNFTYDSSVPVYENRPPSFPYTFDYKIFHDCMIPPCPTKSYPGIWEIPMVMWQDLNGGRCSMGDACSNPPTAEGVYKMLIKNFERHYTTNRAPFGLFYHAAWFTQPHHKEGFEAFLDTLVQMEDVYLVTSWQAIQWMRDPTPLSEIRRFQPFQCQYKNRPRHCNHPKVCNLWHKSGVRYMRTCQPCPEIYPWTGRTGVRNSRIDNEIEE